MDAVLSKKEAKRIQSDEKIIQAAVKVFGSCGYSKATITQIAEEAGVSQGLVSQRYHSKEKLLLEVFEHTRILSFYDDQNRHLPQAFYVLLEHLKQEVREEPDWFRFLKMIHTGNDTPESFGERTKEIFSETPLCSAIIEAQEQDDLPAGDPWDIFRVFFRNATNLIGWYHEFGLPMPENEYFLYAIQYCRRQKDAEAILKNQKYRIQALKTDRDILFKAVSEIYPLIILSNVSRNSYHMLEYEHFMTKRAKDAGTYDDLVSVGASTIPSEIHKEQFTSLFSRENVIRAYRSGKQQLFLRHLQAGDDGITRWIETRVLFQGCECGEILTITLSRQINDEMKRLHSYGEALQKAEMAAGAKSRFLTNLSHEIRTPMNAVIGYSELLTRRTYAPEKVQDYAGKINASGKELMELLSQALDAANLPVYSSNQIKLNINESCGGIAANASLLAKQRGITLDYRNGTIRDYFVYTDEIRLQKCMMSLIFQAIIRSPAKGCVCVRLEQLDDVRDNMARLQLTIHDDGVGMNDELLRRALDDTQKAEFYVMDLQQVIDDIEAMGGTIEFNSQCEGNTVVCVMNFRRVE